MASAVSGADAAGERRVRFLELLMASGAGMERENPIMFFPLVVRVTGPPAGEGGGAPAADRIVLVNPLTQGMVVLGTGGGQDLAAVMQQILAADGGARAGPPPASKASIEAMRAVERPAGEGDREECAVCLDGLWAAQDGSEAEKVAVEVKEMPCRHRFHGGCIEKWLRMHGSCPVCRYRMPEEKLAGGKKDAEERGGGEEEGAGRREIWVSFGFSRRATRGQGEQQQGTQPHAMEDDLGQQQQQQ